MFVLDTKNELRILKDHIQVFHSRVAQTIDGLILQLDETKREQIDPSRVGVWISGMLHKASTTSGPTWQEDPPKRIDYSKDLS